MRQNDKTDNRSPWHAMDIPEVLRRWDSSLSQGLMPKEVEKRRTEWGPNSLPEKKRSSLVLIFLHQFKSPLIYLLIVAAGIAFALGEETDTLVILAVLFINALIGTFQEGRAERSMEALRKLSAVKVRVIRGGSEEMIEARDLVPGDLLLLAGGDAVGADARLVEAASLEVSEAALTGESLPVGKITASLPADTPLADRSNMVYSGTHATAGRARAVVVATALATEVGKIATLTQAAKEPKTPLELKIAQFSRYVLIAALFMFAVVLAVGLLRELPFSKIFMVALSQVVSMVPEGLPVAMTVALAVGMQRMAARGAIVRRLAAVETLGSTNVICSDKTGTLTRNEMTVTEIFLPGPRLIEVTGAGYAPQGEFLEGGRPLSPGEDSQLRELLQAAVLCNDAKLLPPPDGIAWKVLGDPTEAALLSMALKGGVDAEALKKHFARTGEIPFDSATKMMATEVRRDEGRRIFLKGAPEEIMSLCATTRFGGQDLSLDDEVRRGIHEAGEKMAKKALRLLAFAVVENPEADLNRGYESFRGKTRFLGLAGQFDPPRPEVQAAVLECRSAGVRPIMVTGDHKITGLAVARILDIARDGDLAVDGRELSELSEEELRERLPLISVFARVHPAQKLRIVTALQSQNAVVAMTGDGVNDAPALAKADVGVAMGITGTEVAKEASKIVITDDNFATIVQAVNEGRIVYRNLKKLILYLVSTSLTEIVVLFTALVAGLPLPLAAVQILWINLVTDGMMTLPLIMEPPEGDEMRDPPVPRNDPILSRILLKRMALLVPAMAVSALAYFVYRLSSGVPFPQVQTGTFTVIAVCQWFNALNCRSERRSAFRGLFQDRWILGGLFFGNLLHLGVVFLPPLNKLFHTTPIALSEVFLIGASASLVLWVEEIRKLMVRRAFKR